jgi:GntR family transcriptional regulator
MRTVVRTGGGRLIVKCNRPATDGRDHASRRAGHKDRDSNPIALDAVGCPGARDAHARRLGQIQDAHPFSGCLHLRAAVPVAGRERSERDHDDDERERYASPTSTAPGLLDDRAQETWAERSCKRCGRRCHKASITSTIRAVNRDPSTGVGLAELVAAELRRAVADGEARPGERLPPARDLAAVLGVNRNTVLSALRALRDEGLVDFRRGRGITVSARPERGEVGARARELVRFARSRGYAPDELIDIIRAVT